MQREWIVALKAVHPDTPQATVDRAECSKSRDEVKGKHVLKMLTTFSDGGCRELTLERGIVVPRPAYAVLGRSVFPSVAALGLSLSPAEPGPGQIESNSIRE
jgi:hypothetical protein